MGEYLNKHVEYSVLFFKGIAQGERVGLVGKEEEGRK